MAKNNRARHYHLRWDRIALVMVLWILLVFGLWRLLMKLHADPAADSASSAPESATSSFQTETQPTVDTGQWNLILANPDHALPEGFSVDTATLSNGLEVDARIYDSLQQMLSAAQADGVSLLVCSAYRTVERQTELFDAQVQSHLSEGLSQEEATAAAATEVALPGTSEHNTGLALDIVAVDYQMLDDGYADTPEAQWLLAHAAEYGFILRYPQGKESITKIIFEPWHYRYVGTPYAQEIMSSGLCFEEWLQSVS